MHSNRLISRGHRRRVLCGWLLRLVLASVLAESAAARAEPDLKAAEGWWPDLTDYWTPVGWKHHRFRFNVFFDGTLYADPALSQTARAWAGQGVQIRFRPLAGNGPAPAALAAGNPTAPDKMRSERYVLQDDRSCLQGWDDGDAPVLWTEWSRQGLLLRQRVFAHVPGGRDGKTGTEPLFAWVRLSVERAAPAVTPPSRYGFGLQLNAPNVTTGMYARHNITMHPERSRYPRTLRADRSGGGLKLVEPDGGIRLAVPAESAAEIGFLPAEDGGKDPLVTVTMDSVPGRFVDVLVPMVPTEPGIVERELRLGYDGALAEANRFWAPRPATAATIDVPEPYIGDTIRQFERYAQVLSERVPETGTNVSLSGSLAYVRVWATPTGKMVSMFLDPLGYHDLAGEFLEPFIEAQGSRKPPSKFLSGHPGYLGSPAAFKSIDWMADHGSLLFAIANHALLIADPAAKRRYVEPIVKACEFIEYARATKGHGGYEGILPPARYSDAREETQGVWNDGWNYKGLVTAARFLRQIGHPRADEFTREAEDYKRTFVAALRDASSKARTWTDSAGHSWPLVPTSLYGYAESTTLHPFYLDTGPMQLVFAGLMEADDPLMQAALHWFRDGPILDFARYNSTFAQVGFLVHEMSSCIPGYSWNVFINHKLGDRQHFLEGMYSQFAGAISRKTRTVCETRYGITGRITHADTPFYLARLAVVDDQVADNELHLLRLCPLAWVSTERESVFENMPTAFGPVTLRWRLSEDRRTLDVRYTPRFHHQPSRVIIHAPPVEGLAAMRINGREYAIQPGGSVQP